MKILFRRLLFLFFCFLYINSLLAQVLSGEVYVPGKYLIQFDNSSNLSKFQHKLISQRSSIVSERLTPASSILTIEKPDLTMEEVTEIVKNLDGVVAFQHDAYLEERAKLPNDPLFNAKQWDMKIIKGPEAWEITTGGYTPLGHEIVVGVLDGGYYVNHPDLSPNLFVNKEEIAGNGIDDDNNGFVDDVSGVNLENNSGVHATATHGAGVMGIIGAKGNNGIGMAGVNWDVKIIPVSKAVATVSGLVKGYEYLKEFRIKFNESNGTKGAFIVAVNLSAGISNKFPVDHPVWCNEYDLLGQAGILNAGATANQNVDVETAGDLPSTCPSEYLLVVTNTNSSDVKHQSSGYGNVSVDLGAPGDGSTSTSSPDGYELFGGTSSATPHVAGAIALMYAAKNTGLEKTYMEYPVESARAVRNSILNNVDILPSLIGKTVSGGRLNLYRMLSNFVASSHQLKIKTLTTYPNPVTNLMSVDLDDSLSGYYKIEIIDIQGKSIYSRQHLSNGQQLSLDIPSIAPGVYFLKISSGKYNAVSKFIKL